jgi:DNA-binding IclR family transcriptional regulator
MVPVVQSTFRILEELSRSGALGLNEVTQRTGISKSTVFRILTTLTRLGYVVRDSARTYYVSQSMGDLVSAEAGIEAVRRAALPHMLELRDQYGETVNLGHLEFDKVTYVEVVPSEYALRLHERPGATVCLHASALGKAILAFSDDGFADNLIRGRELPMLTRNTITDPRELMGELRRVRERGYAFDRGETSLQASCVAAPIFNSSGSAIAAISISGPSSRFNPRRDSGVIESLLKATSAIARQLRAHPEAASKGIRRVARQR